MTTMRSQDTGTNAGAPRFERLSIVIEWANTRLNGVPRAYLLFDRLVRQWREILERKYPATLPAVAGRFLDSLAERPELVVVSGEALDAHLEERIRTLLSDDFEVAIRVAEGLEYYPLKNFGAGQVSGDFLLFVDSDLLPDDGWLAHLLGSFANPEVGVVAGQTYVAPTDLVSRAYALGWTYELRNEAGGLHQRRKFYANQIVFRAEIFPQNGFPSIGPMMTRGACRLLRNDFERRGIPIWQNDSAAADHPPPSSFQHMVVRALAHGRDRYMMHSKQRSLRGLTGSLGTATRRFARACRHIFWDRRRVGLQRWEIPAALVIMAGYYGFFALGGLFTYVSPRGSGRRFRV